MKKFPYAICTSENRFVVATRPLNSTGPTKETIITVFDYVGIRINCFTVEYFVESMGFDGDRIFLYGLNKVEIYTDGVCAGPFKLRNAFKFLVESSGALVIQHGKSLSRFDDENFESPTHKIKVGDGELYGVNDQGFLLQMPSYISQRDWAGKNSRTPYQKGFGIISAISIERNEWIISETRGDVNMVGTNTDTLISSGNGHYVSLGKSEQNLFGCRYDFDSPEKSTVTSTSLKTGETNVIFDLEHFPLARAFSPSGIHFVHQRGGIYNCVTGQIDGYFECDS